jgi:hypothetical protein
LLKDNPEKSILIMMQISYKVDFARLIQKIPAADLLPFTNLIRRAWVFPTNGTGQVMTQRHSLAQRLQALCRPFVPVLPGPTP